MGMLGGNVAIVTGGSRGIGRAIAKRLALEGASVVVNYATNELAALQVVDEITGLGQEAIALKASVTSMDEVQAMVEQTIETFGKVDILVNNAGVARDTLLLRMREEDWSAVLDTNISGMFRACKAVARPMLKEKYGRIVNLSSIAAVRAGKGQCNYAASKGAVNSFTRALAVELAPKGITVNAVMPGMVETDMSRSVLSMAKEEILSKIPMKRLGQPEDIAGIVAFLASKEAAYLTGAVIPVDGAIQI
jgi:3-oxoacyl-[acyl-carrier protein] reductase